MQAAKQFQKSIIKNKSQAEEKSIIKNNIHTVDDSVMVGRRLVCAFAKEAPAAVLEVEAALDDFTIQSTDLATHLRV